LKAGFKNWTENLILFIGQDRVPPIKDFDLFKNEVRLLTRERERSTSTGLRFYVETFLQKFISYRTKWDRGLRGY